MVVTATVALLPGYRRLVLELSTAYAKHFRGLQIELADTVTFGITAMVAILMLVWMVTLMYRAFSVSCNVTGGKAIGVFIASVILGEVISKALIILLFVSSV